MAKRSIINNSKDMNEPFIDQQLICSICNKSFNDTQYFSCGHTFCRQCITQNMEKKHVSCSICRQVNNYEDEQTTLPIGNIYDPINKEQDQVSAAFLFEPFRSLLLDLSNQNRPLKEEMNYPGEQSQLQLSEQSKKNEQFQVEINQLKKETQLQHHTLVEQLKNVNNQFYLCVKQLNEQSKKNEKLQLELNQLREQSQLQLSEQWKKDEQFQVEINQLKKETQLQHHTLIEQLKDVNNQYDLCVKQLNEQSKKNEKLQLELNQLREQSQLQMTEQSKKIEVLQLDINQLYEDRFQTDDQNENAEISEVNPLHNLSEINVEHIQDPINYLSDTKWKQVGITIAGENGYGNKSNQLYSPYGICIDDDQTIYIADYANHRVLEWKPNAANGRIAAGGNGTGSQNNQFNGPRSVIIDRDNNSLIISDWGNRRVIRSFRQNNANGQIIIEDIDCFGLAMDKNGSLYVSDCRKNEVRRWKRGEKEGTIVAGGNKQGNNLNQLNYPTYIFVDEDYSLYVSDRDNHRVMKWLKDAKEGIIVAGGQGQGNSLTQLSRPEGVIVDQFGQIYIADFYNDRVMRWCKGEKKGTIVVGGNGRGQQSNQFSRPTGLSFDPQGNLYVVDFGNHRIQKFGINYNENNLFD